MQRNTPHTDKIDKIGATSEYPLPYKIKITGTLNIPIRRHIGKFISDKYLKTFLYNAPNSASSF